MTILQLRRWLSMLAAVGAGGVNLWLPGGVNLWLPGWIPLAAVAPVERLNPVVLFVADGVRQDMVKEMIAEGKLPNYKKVFDNGVDAGEGLIPVLPAVTAPNWATLATGRSPGIHGAVTYLGSPATDVHLMLRFYDGSGWSTAATTRTDAQGRYAFASVPSLGPDQAYYVRYDNETDDRFLWEWLGPDILAYVAGASVHGGDFDIANVGLVSPKPGASVALPVTFSWQRRGVAGDTFKVHLIDPQSSQQWWSNDLGDTDHGLLAALPEGADYGVEYGWDVFVYDGSGGYGSSFYAQSVTFLHAAAQSDDSRWVRSEGVTPMHAGASRDSGSGRPKAPVGGVEDAAHRR